MLQSMKLCRRNGKNTFQYLGNMKIYGNIWGWIQFSAVEEVQNILHDFYLTLRSKFNVIISFQINTGSISSTDY